ncbi:unnamed protein product, partial [marine sediment metagenome]
ATAGVIWILVGQSGYMVFNNCHFDGTTGTPTIGIQATAVGSLKIENCEFLGGRHSGGFSTAAIDILAGAANGTQIKNNFITADGIGIRTNAATTFAELGVCKDNRIISTGKAISDSSNTTGQMACINNLMITETNNGSGTAYDLNVDFCIQNWLVSGGDNETHRIPVDTDEA